VKEKEERKVGRFVEGKRVNAGAEGGGRRGEGAACAREGRVRGYRSIVSVAAAANLRLSAADRRKTEREKVTGTQYQGTRPGFGCRRVIRDRPIRYPVCVSRPDPKAVPSGGRGMKGSNDGTISARSLSRSSRSPEIEFDQNDLCGCPLPSRLRRYGD
jgi:hypothetical protein